MKKLKVVLFVAVAFFSLTQMAVADQVATVGGYGPYQTGNGGEFTFSPTGSTLPGFLSNYAATTSNVFQAGTFQSFCLEEGEYIYPNTVFDAVLNTKAVEGGIGPAGDPISIGTAYLYSQFARGTLATYDYTVTGRSASASALQNAIWFLEGEGGAYNGFVTAAITALGPGATLDDAKADANGAFGVMVLNLYAAGYAGDLNYRRQDQLILTSVPEPLTMMLLGLGLIGVAGIRRKFKS